MSQQSHHPTFRYKWSRHLLWIALLSLLLMGINALYYPVLNWHHVRTAEPGELLYAAGFDDFGDEWQQYDGRRSAQMRDSVMRLALDTPDTIYTTAAPIYADFDMSVNVQAIEGALENDGYGVIFRLSDQGAAQTCSRRFVTVCDLERLPLLNTIIPLVAPPPPTQATGYYVFLISNDGYYRLLRGNTQDNLLQAVTIWHDSGGMLNTGLNAQNRIRVVGRGNQFQFFLNQEPVLLCIPLADEQPTGTSADCLGEETFIWEDDHFATGKLGFVLNAARQVGDVVEFDDLVVTMPATLISEGNDA